MAGNQLNITIGGSLSASLTQSVNQASASLQGLGNAAESAFDEIAAGAAAMDRISASIDEAAAAAIRANQTFEGIGSSAVRAITPLSTLENRLQEIQVAIGQSGTVQGAANLGAQYDILNRTLQQTRAQIDSATTSAISLGRAFNTVASSSTSLNRLAPAVRPALTDLRLLPPAANAAGSSLANIRPGANQAGNALMNLGRVAQDAPFGFIGIANNLNPLLESFQRLRVETGSASGAFRALGSSLLGAGGLGVALSLVTAIVSFASIGFSAWTRGMSGSKSAADKAKESAEELAKAIRDVAVIQGEAVASVQGQIAQINSLAGAIGDANRPYAERKRALEELKDINKAYFNDLKIEDAATGKLAATIAVYNQALINSAIQKQFIDEIATVAKAIVKSEAEITKARDARGRAEAEALQIVKENAQFLNKNDVGRSAGVKDAIDKQTAYNNAIAKQVEANKALKTAQEADVKLREQSVLLTQQLNAATQEGLKFKSLQTDGDKKEVDLLKQRIDALKELEGLTGLDRSQRIELAQLEIDLARRDGIKLGLTKGEIEQQVDGIMESFFPVKTFEFKLEALTLKPKNIDLKANVQGAVLPNNLIPTDVFDKLIERLRKGSELAKAKVSEIAIDLKSFLGSALADSFSALGESIANAFQGGGFQSIIAPFTQVIGGAIEALGKAAIQAGTAALLLKETIKKFIIANPALVIAAGVAAVAVGSLIKNSFNATKIPGFADGVNNFSGGFALVGERGPELVRLPGGSDVIPNGSFGGGNITVNGVIRGRDIYLANARETQTRRRI